MALSTDGSLLATGNENVLKMWSGNTLALLETLDLDFQLWTLAILQDSLLAIGSSYVVVLYGINNHTFVVQLPIDYARAIAFSPDCTCLATAGGDLVQLWDILSIRSGSYSTSQGHSSTAHELAFSPDCSHLVSAHEDKTICLWDTSNTTLPIITHRGDVKRDILQVSFSTDGGKFTSWSKEGIIQLWNSEDGAPRGVLKYSDIFPVSGVVLSSSILAAATKACITLWDLQTCTSIATLDQHNTSRLAISHHPSHMLLATVSHDTLKIWDTSKHTPIITYNLSDDDLHHTRMVRDDWGMKFLPDRSRLAIAWDSEYDYMDRYESFHHIQLFNIHDCGVSEVYETPDINQLGLLPSWNGIPVCVHAHKGVYVRFPKKDIPVLCYPFERSSSSATGSSMIALGLREDGRIILVKAI